MSEHRPRKRKRRKRGSHTSEKQKIMRWKDPPFNIKNLDELIQFAWEYRGKGVDTEKLWKLITPLTQLKKMVGMEKLKEDIVHLVMYYVQGIHNMKDVCGNTIDEEQDMLHTVLCGPPGTGKTAIAHILSKLYSRLGFLSSDKVVIAKRTDFIGKYVGHSEHKTKELLNSAMGGVLLIDEAYSMGCDDKTDSFSKAAIDVLNQYLTEHKDEFVCIIAGYEEDLEKSFFSINKGLKRRFPWKFKIDNYTPEELSKIFYEIIRKRGWKIVENVGNADFFKTHKENFPFYGGDMEILFCKCKLVHVKRIFGIADKNVIKLLTDEDLMNGFELYMKNREKEDDSGYSHMYI